MENAAIMHDIGSKRKALEHTKMKMGIKIKWPEEGFFYAFALYLLHDWDCTLMFFEHSIQWSAWMDVQYD